MICILRVQRNHLKDTPVGVLVMKQVAVECSILIKLNWLAQQQKLQGCLMMA